jgi:hypothetical protein
MGLPIHHGSQNMNHIRLITNKFNYVKARYDYLLNLHNRARKSFKRRYRYYGDTHFIKGGGRQRVKPATTTTRYRSTTVHKSSLTLPLLKPSSSSSSTHFHHKKFAHLRKTLPIISNMPFIHLNSSLILINSSPFGLTDRRFGILHHHSPSASYY